MCLYEFEMVHRFLQNREYFDVKGDTLLLAIMYCCIMFALKILLKQCQKTDVSANYVTNSICNLEGAGKKTMLLTLHAAEANLTKSKPCFNPDHSVVGDACNFKAAESQTFVDILSEDATENKISDNKFIKHLQMFFDKNEDVLKLPADFDLLFKNTRSMKDPMSVIKTCVQCLKTFINSFWSEVADRTAFAGLETGPTSYSEAPAEGVFSVIEYVMTGREKLSLKHVEALTRISLEGPKASTKKAFELSCQAMQKRDCKDKDRFTTIAYMKGTISKTVQKIQSGDL